MPIEVKSGHYDIKEVAKAFNRIGQSSGILITRDTYEIIKTDTAMISICPIDVFAMYPHEILNNFVSQVNE